MIEKMTKYSFILLNEQCGDFMKGLRELGVVDITRSPKPVDETSERLFDQSEELKKALTRLYEVQFPTEIQGADETSTQDRLIAASEAQLTREGNAAAISAEDFATATQKAFEDLEKFKVSLAKASAETQARKHWGLFDSKVLEDLEAQGFKLRFYIVPEKRFDPSWAELYPLEVINKADSKVYFVTISDDPQYSFPLEETAAPEGTYEESAATEHELTKAILLRQKEILALKARLPEMEKVYAQKVSDLDLYLAGIAGDKAVENRICVVEGFAPSTSDEELKVAFDQMDVFYQKSDASVVDNPPIKLKNNRFASMFEVLTDMYGRPAYDGFDPTPYISVFFLLFFAFCMGDAGYGLILILAGLALKKVKGFASMAPLVTTLGVGTLVIGTLFHTFFSIDIAFWSCIPHWLKAIMVPAKVAGYDGTMMLALAVGIVHLCIAMIVKTIYATKQKGFLQSLSTWGWTLFIVGSVVTGVVALAGVIDMALTKWIIIGLGLVSALGIFFLNDLHRNPLLNIGAGLWETYNTATGLLGDVLSYLRLYALGLAGSMLGFAFNDLGKMVLGDGSFGMNWIFFVLIVLIGHTLNIAMAALGAFVHPLRLNFLEFFKNSGYEGVGRNFRPLSK